MNFLISIVCLLLVPLAAAGLALIHMGLGRSRSAAHCMLATLCVIAISAIVFVSIGSSVAGVSGGAFHAIQLHTRSFNWLGAEPILARGVRFDGTSGALILCLQMFTSGLAAIIPISAGTDRWRMLPICLSTAVLGSIIYPLFAHWTWGGGWLAELSSSFGLGSGFIDCGGAGTIHIIGGLSALSVAWIVGGRGGKYAEDGMATAIPGHNIALVLFGCILTLVGCVAVNCAGAMLFYEAAPGGLVKVIINTVLSSAAACLAAVITTQLRYRKPDASISANGWVGGLVAVSAGCAFISPAFALVIGLIGGVIVTYMVEICELRLYIDDPGGAISVHACAGMWGLLAVGLFGHLGKGSGQLLAQLVGIATLIGFMLPVIVTINLLLNRLVPYRVDAAGLAQGMDIRELGAGAYPEFIVHTDEFIPR